jgi:hypothetical protein
LYGKLGQAENGLAVLADAQILADKNSGERYFIAEMYRLKGKLLMQGIKDKTREAAFCDINNR